MGDDENWDLSAIVRSCTSASSANRNDTEIESGSPLDCLASMTFDEEDDDAFSFQNLVQPEHTGFQELQDSYKPFLPATSDTIPIPTTPSVAINNDNNHSLNININNIPTSRSNSSSICEFGGLISNIRGIKSHPRPPPLIVQQQPQPPPTSSTISIIPRVVNSNRNIQHQQPPVQRQQQQPNERGDGSPSVRPLRTMQSHHHPPLRSIKKKSHQKRLVLQVTAENLSNDMWAWRKYGQKPIKDSPYPRWSSSKGCAARKKVERANSDPNMFILSYSGDHTHLRPTHRNSLAGSTRNKFSSSVPKTTNQVPAQPHIPIPIPADHNKEVAESSNSSSSLSPETPLNHQMNLTNMCYVSLGEGGTMEHQDVHDADDEDGDKDILIPNMAWP